MTNEHSIAAAPGVLHYVQANAYSQSRSQGLRTPNALATHRAFSVAISREAGIDAGAYARAIGKQLGWPVWDHELLELIARRLGSNVRALESLDERHVSWIQESLEAFLSLHEVNHHSYARHLREAMEDLAAHGNCILVGRGAAHILPAKTTLKVRLVAPREQRITAFRQQTGIDEKHAARELEKIDRERIRFVNEHFHKNSADPAAYDMVLNIAHCSETDCAARAGLPPGHRASPGTRRDAAGNIGFERDQRPRGVMIWESGDTSPIPACPTSPSEAAGT